MAGALEYRRNAHSDDQGVDMNPISRIVGYFNRRVLGRPFFATSDVKIGRHVSFGRNVSFHCERVRIGDGVVFHDNISIHARHFEIGDYGTIYSYCFFPGGRVKIGHNYWMGYGSLVDGRGGTRIGNNVCAGTHSQFWTHMIFGDVMYGSRFHSIKELVIEDDVWFSGQCLVSPIHAGARSVAMLGSVITKNMQPDRIYAGVPATDITEKGGPPYNATSIEDRVKYMKAQLGDFARTRGITDIDRHAKIVTSSAELPSSSENTTVFNVADRTYSKTGSALENKLMRFLLPEAKFIPIN